MTLGTERLGLATLRRLPVDCRPLLRPGTVPAGVVHLGLGAIRRAHQAVHTEAAIGAAGGDWGIVGVAPRSTAVVDALFALREVFPADPAADDEVRADVTGWLSTLERHGVRATLAGAA
ncbi:hypothetical protein [Micromonospora sp. NPDC005299]|uniref:hypothetical protein n=1 Tax=Micromonospora sp. NPDC005299 TaxID=3364231 RepID=UPI00367AC50C